MKIISPLYRLKRAINIASQVVANGITEGFHNKMETISRMAYGFRNFENYRLRVRVMCA